MQLMIKKFNEDSLQIEDRRVSEKWDNDNEQYKSLNDWIKKHKIKSEKIKIIGLKNAISFGTYEKLYDKKSLGYFVNAGNNCQFNQTHVNIFSVPMSNTMTMPHIYPQNFDKIILSYSVRSLIKSNWLNNNDEYRVPSESIQFTDKYKQFNNDCYVYSLFSLQSSMRNVKNFDNTTFNIFNHFFYMSNKEMKELADKYNFQEMYQDADEFHEDRYMYNQLNEIELSDDAKEVLESLRQLTRDSMKYRELAHQEDEKFHLNTWDAGWYQLRMGIIKKYMPIELKEFMIKFKKFENRLRPYVYEFGFLPHENALDI